MKYFQHAIIIFTLALLAITLVLLSAQNFEVQNFITSSDQVAIPTMVIDAINHPTEFYGWMLPRANFLFPDALIYATFYLLTEHRYLSILLTSAMILLAWMLVIFYANVSIGNKRPLVAASWAAVVGGLIPYLLLAFSDNLGFFAFKFQFIMAGHFSAFVVAALILILSVKYLESNIKGLNYGCYFLLTIIAASNRSSWVYVVLPLVLLIIIELFKDSRPNNNWRAVRFGGGVFISVFLGYIFESISNRQEIMPYATNLKGVISNLSSFYESIISHPIISLYFIVLLCFYLWQLLLVLPIIFGARYWHCSLEEREYVLFKFAIIVCALINIPAAIFLWGDIASSRYLMAFFFSAVILIPLSLIYLDRFIYAIVTIFLSISIIISLPFVTKIQLQPNKPLLTDITAINNCVAKHNLHRGLADYWIARKISFFSNEKIHLDQLVPWGFLKPSQMIFYWGNNSTSFLKGNPNNDPYDYIITNGLNEKQLHQALGTPKKKIICGSYKIFQYADSYLLFRELLRGHGEIFAREMIGKGIVSIPAALFYTQHGQYKDLLVEKNVNFNAAGFLLWGNNIKLKKGHYQFAVNYLVKSKDLDNVEAYLDVVTNAGKVVLGKVPIDITNPASNVSMEIELSRTTIVEPRVYVGNITKNIKLTIDSLVIKKLD